MNERDTVYSERSKDKPGIQLMTNVINKLKKYEMESRIYTRATNILRRVKSYENPEEAKKELNQGLIIYKNLFLNNKIPKNNHLYQIFKKTTDDKSALHPMEESEIETEYRKNLDGPHTEKFEEKSIKYLKQYSEDVILASLLYDEKPHAIDEKEEIKKIQNIFELLYSKNRKKRNDFMTLTHILDKKTFASYLILRSLKEPDSWWIRGRLQDFSWNKELMGEIEAQQNKLLKTTLPENRSILLKAFKRSMNIKKEIKPLSTPSTLEKPKEKELSQTSVPLNFTLETSSDGDTPEFIKGDPFEEKESGVEKKRQVKLISIMNPRIDGNGNIISDKIDEIPENLRIIFGDKNYKDAASFSAIFSLSSGSPPWTLKNIKDYPQIVKLTNAFEESIVGLRLDKNYRLDLTQKLTDSILKDDFSIFNKQIAILLFKNYYQTANNPTESDVEQFAKIPGIINSVTALKKIFLTDLCQNQHQTLSKKEESLYTLSPSEEVWQNMKSPQILINNNQINLSELSKFTNDQLVDALAFLVVEKYAETQKSFFKNGSLGNTFISNDKKFLSMPDRFDELVQSHIIQSDIEGLSIQITSELGSEIRFDLKVSKYYQSFNQLIIYYNGKKLTNIPIVID